jgi:phage shock protein E
MRRSTASLCVLTLLAAFAAACSQSSPPAPPAGKAETAAAPLPDRDPALARRLVASGAVLLDVRTPEEYEARHLDGAVNIPVADLDGRLAEIEKLTGGDKHKPIVVHCQAGGRAARAKTRLLEAGYTQVTNMGGIDAWDSK